MKIILAHRHLDFDALASMVAVQKLYPDARLVIDGKYGSFVQDFLALAKEHFPYYRIKDIDIDQVKTVFLVDTHDLNRAVGNKDILGQLKNAGLIVVDHHPYNGPKRDHYTIENVGACTTILVEKIKETGLKMTGFEATLMMLGIYDDTGSLLFENTTSRDILAAAFLLEQGANLGVVAEYLHRPLTEEQMDLFQDLLDNGQTEIFEGTHGVLFICGI
jgi:tRNA nucleotidyltransferase (CCA-adding enzyme)